MRVRLTIHTAVLAVTLAGCGGEAPPAADVSAATTAPAAPLPLNAGPVEVCNWLPAGDAERLVGPLSAPPERTPPQGSLLGECTYHGEPGKLLMVSARPANEYDATVEYTTREGVNRPVDGLVGPARLTRAGLMMQPPGKPYFVVVFGIGHTEDAVLAVARALQP